LLYWDRSTRQRSDWYLTGGSRVWVSRPMGDEAEDTYAGDNMPCKVEVGKNLVRVTGGVHPFLKIQRGFKVRALMDDTFEVTAFMKNCGDLLYSGGVWCPTCIDPSGDKEFGVPLGDWRSNWDVAKVVIPRRWGGHTSALDDPQISFTKDCLVLKPAGMETKRMLNASLGIVAVTWQEKRISFLKRSEFDPNGIYPVDSNIALYEAPGNTFVEMEIMGSQHTIRPGEMIQLTETWKLVDRVLDWNDAAAILEIFDQ